MSLCENPARRRDDAAEPLVRANAGFGLRVDRHFEPDRHMAWDLVGNVNLIWAEFYGLWYAAAGNPRSFRVSEEEHPVLAREIIAYIGGGTPDYEPSAEETALLGYDRGVLRQEVEACIAYYAAL